MGYLGQQATFTGSQNNKRISVIATDGQTLFTVAGGYNINQLDVYRNGVKLSGSRDFTALDGTSVTLLTGASANDIVEFVVFENFDVADALTGDGDQSLNGNLTVTGYVAPTIPIAIASEAIRAGVATAADSLNGGATASNGINVSGITTTDFLEVDFNASFTGISTFSNDLNVTGNITGTAATFTGNVTVGGTLTYEDVTNIDSIGLITARNGLQVTGGIATVSGQTNLANVNVSAAATVSGRFVPTDTRLSSIADKTTVVDGNTVSLSYSTGGGNVAICTNPSGAITLNVTNIPTSSDFDNRSISFAVIVNQGATAYACTDVTLNGVAYGARATAGVATHIAYPSGTVAAGNTSAYDVFNFTGINTSVVGSASTTANYKIISNVNGDYRLY